MPDIDTLIERSGVHDQWREAVASALAAVDPDYLAGLLADSEWLPGADRLLAAFRRDRDHLQYLLIGESPYPRPESANGIAFFDASVGALWNENGMSKAINRATSLRNLVKTALLAEEHVTADAEGKLSQAAIASIDKRSLVQTLPELFDNLERAGFLLLNATLVLHPARKPAIEAGYWKPFLGRLLEVIARDSKHKPRLVLWGKIARLVETMPASTSFARIACEHPYNVSFIDNPDMRALFARLRLLQPHPVP